MYSKRTLSHVNSHTPTNAHTHTRLLSRKKQQQQVHFLFLTRRKVLLWSWRTNVFLFNSSLNSGTVGTTRISPNGCLVTIFGMSTTRVFRSHVLGGAARTTPTRQDQRRLLIVISADQVQRKNGRKSPRRNRVGRRATGGGEAVTRSPAGPRRRRLDRWDRSGSPVRHRTALQSQTSRVRRPFHHESGVLHSAGYQSAMETRSNLHLKEKILKDVFHYTLTKTCKYKKLTCLKETRLVYLPKIY